MKLEVLYETPLNDLKQEVLPKAREIAAKADFVFKTGSGAFRATKSGVWFCVGLGNSKNYDPTSALDDEVRHKFFAIQMAKMLGEYSDKGSEIRIGSGLSTINDPVKKEDIKDAILRGIKRDAVGGIRSGEFMPCISWYVGAPAGVDSNEQAFTATLRYNIERDKPVRRYGRPEKIQSVNIEIGTLTSDPKVLKSMKELVENINHKDRFMERHGAFNNPDNRPLVKYFFDEVGKDIESAFVGDAQSGRHTIYYGFDVYVRGPVKTYQKEVKIISNHEFEILLRKINDSF